MNYRGIFKLPGLFNQYKYSRRTTQTFKMSMSSAVICATNEITQVAFHISSKVITGCVFMDKLLCGGGPSCSLHVCDHSLSTWGLTRCPADSTPACTCRTPRPGGHCGSSKSVFSSKAFPCLLRFLSIF